jgi:hypothetical protein
MAVAFSRPPDYTRRTVSAHRLAVRTPPSHGGNRGSIPLGRTSLFQHRAAIRGKPISCAPIQAVKSVPGSLPTKRFETARPAAIMLACCALLATAACTRTSDGSIELDRLELAQPKVPNLFKLRLPGWQASRPAPTQTAAQFPRKPPAPQPVARSKPAPAKVRARPRRVTTPQPPAVSSKPEASAEPSKPLVCRNDSRAAGRIRVVCE